MSGKYKQYLITFNLFDGTMRSVPIEIPLGEPGEPGGYYKPVTEQISDTEFEVSFVPSNTEMPAVDPVRIYSFSPRVKVTESDDGVTLYVKDYIGESEAIIRHGKNGKTPVKGFDYTDGYSIYYMSIEVEYPVDGFVAHSTSQVNLSNNGSGVKVGDLLISSNGVICNVTSVSANSVGFNPVAKIGYDTDDIVTAVLNALPTWTGGSY